MLLQNVEYQTHYFLHLLKTFLLHMYIGQPCLSAQLQTVAEFEVQNTSGTYDQAVKPLKQIEEATTHNDSIQSLQYETPLKSN